MASFCPRACLKRASTATDLCNRYGNGRRRHMRKTIWTGLGASCLVLLCQTASAQQWMRLPGYLSPQEMPDASAMLGPPPANGTGTKAGDVATYQATRALKD